MWLSKLINQLWLVMWRMWDHRNKINKGTRTAQDQSDVDKLHLEVRREFNLGKQGLLPTDYHLVEDRSQILSYDLPQLKAWHSRILLCRYPQWTDCEGQIVMAGNCTLDCLFWVLEVTVC